MLMVGFSALPVSAGDEAHGSVRIVRFSLVDGEVRVISSDQFKWEPAIVNMPVEQGLAVAAREGRAEIELEDGSAVWLSRESVLQFTELGRSIDGRITKIFLVQGTVTFYANLGAHVSFGVDTSQFHVVLPGKSEFRVNITNFESSVTVFKGKVTVSSSKESKEVHKGETLVWNKDARIDAQVNRSSPKDAWDRWVDSRQDHLSSSRPQSQESTNSSATKGLPDIPIRINACIAGSRGCYERH
jgi:hypothetical protein